MNHLNLNDLRRHEEQRLDRNRAMNAEMHSRIRHVRRVRPTVGAVVFIFLTGVGFGMWLCSILGGSR